MKRCNCSKCQWSDTETIMQGCACGTSFQPHGAETVCPHCAQTDLLAKVVKVLPTSKNELAAVIGVTPQRLSAWLRAARGEALSARDAGRWPPAPAQLAALLPLVKESMAELAKVEAELRAFTESCARQS